MGQVDLFRFVERFGHPMLSPVIVGPSGTGGGGLTVILGASWPGASWPGARWSISAVIHAGVGALAAVIGTAVAISGDSSKKDE